MIKIDPAYLKARFKEHFSYASKFADALNERYDLGLTVNPNSFGIVVKSAYDDVIRYKEYHLENPGSGEADGRSDCVKRAAYLAKWINRLRPIEKIGTIEIPEIHSVLVNAYFSLYMIESFISAERGQPFHLDQEVTAALVYDFTYRELSGDALLNFCFLLERLVVRRPVIQINPS